MLLSRLSVLLQFFVFSLPTTSFLFAESSPYEEMVTAYAKYGGERYMIQEEIIQRSHILQAAYLADVAGAPQDIIVALLFHDIGQVADKQYAGNADYLHANHDEIGAQWLLTFGFPSHVCDFVRYHTLAKVALCTIDPEYYSRLSTASKISYQIQRKKFGDKAVEAFKNHDYAREFMAARRCDDMAKIVGFNTCDDGGNVSREDRPLSGFENYAEAIDRVLNGQGGHARNEDWIERVETMYWYMANDRAAFEELIKTTDPNDIIARILQ